MAERSRSNFSHLCLALVAAMALAWSATAFAQDVAPAPAPPKAPAASAAAARPGFVSNIWIDSDLREVLRDISMQSGIAVVADQSVQGIISMAAKDMPVEECLERVCASGGYSFVRIKDYYVVGRADPGTEIFRRLSELHRLTLKHASTDQVRAMLPPALLPYVTFDKANNAVLIDAPPAIRQRVMDAIALVDSPNQQLVVEAIVFELTEDGSKQLGVDWKYKNDRLTVGTENLIGTVTFDQSQDFATFIDVALRAIVQEQKGQILANPRIVVINGNAAEIFVGQEKYFSLLSGQASNPYYRLESIKAGVTLKVVPHIGSDGEITLELEPEVSDVADSWDRQSPPNVTGDALVTNVLPVVTRRHARTVVALKDGQSVLIGGLLREQHRTLIEKIPVLGDIPVLGILFRNVRELKSQQEVVILITTHLMGAGGNSSTAAPMTRLGQRYVSPLDALREKSQGVK
jgi:type IV pilus assembly protein PilQ